MATLTLRSIALLSLVAWSLGIAQDLDPLKPGLLRFHPKLTEFKLVSSCRADSTHSVVVVRGAVAYNRLEGNPAQPAFYRQEAFGVFVVDSAMNPLIELEVFQSQRWMDYDVRVDECPPGSAVVTGLGATYGDQPRRVVYFYDLKKRAIVNRLPYDPVSIEWIESGPGGLYFIGPIVVARFDPSRPSQSEVTPFKEILEVRRDGGTLVLLTETQRFALSAGKWLARPNPEPGLFRYNPTEPVPGLPDVRVWAPLFRVQRHTVFLENPGQASRRLIVWNGEISSNSFGGETASGVYEITSGRRRFFPLLQPDWGTFRKLRPARVRDGYGSGSEFREEIGPFQAVADRIWFGASFYDGEGITGIGGLGWFDTTASTFRLRYLPETADWSASAILADQDELWLGLVRHPEGADIPGGLAQVRLSDWTVTVHKLPQIVRVIRKVDDMLYLGTSDGVFRLGPRGLDRIAVRRSADGGYYVTVER